MQIAIYMNNINSIDSEVFDLIIEYILNEKINT